MYLYKYLEKQYLHDWFNNGAIIFSPLQRFIQKESDSVTADEFEGARLYDSKETKIYLNNIEISADSIEAIAARYDYTEERIISSFSTECSKELQKHFKADVILEFDFDDNMQELFSSLKIKYGIVKYLSSYFSEKILPNDIIFCKRASYQPEKEYRFAFPQNISNISKEFYSITMFSRITNDNILKQKMRIVYL
jgi:hypothetical protein